MTPVFSTDIITRVKDEADIVEVVRRCVDLKPAGSVLKGLCPFHKEKTPSFIVTPARQTYHCFGCGAGGDVISFLMESEGMTFPEAVELLARPLDIDLSTWLRDDESEGERRAFHRANETAMNIWREALWDSGMGKKTLTYLRERGFGDKVLRDFDVGFAPADGNWTAQRLAQGGVDQDLAQQADLLRPRDEGGSFAYFRNRVIFPIKNISRQVAGFGGRVIDRGEPKYLNSSDSPFFSKGKLLYGFEASRMPIAREKTAILVEGYLDLLALAQAGILNVVATCGTAFTIDQARLIRRGAQKLVVLFDGDKAGVKAAVRSADVAIRLGLGAKIASLPQGEDPASMLEGDDSSALWEVLQGAEDYIPYLHRLAAASGSSREVMERALRQALTTVAGVQDDLHRDFLLEEAAEIFGKDKGLLQDTVQRERQAARPRERSAARGVPAGAAGQQVAPLRPEAPVAQARRQGGPQVRNYLTRVKVDQVEAQLFAHVLQDETGQAARVFLAERADIPLHHQGAAELVAELERWVAEGTSSGPGSLRDFVTGRWNQIGDAEYRGFISELLSKEEFPQATDHVKIIRDCLGRLLQDRRSRRS